jgi:hypothetical protein
MVLVLFALTIFSFLLLGSIAFLISALLPWTRRYALSTALWLAVWGPCVVVLMLVAGLGVVTGALVMRAGGAFAVDAPRLVSAVGWTYLIAGSLVIAGVATAIAWFHQKLIHRFTLALFRLYSAAVSAGIGSVLGWCLGWWIATKGASAHGSLWWVSGMIVLMAGFGIVAYVGARGLRGNAPTRFTWITPEEFAGNGKR